MQRSARYLAGLLALSASGLAAPAPTRATTCEGPVSCICQKLPTENVLRGRIASFEGARATIEVHEVLASRSQVGTRPGATIAGIVDEENTCQLPETRLAPGDEVLALWRGRTHDQLKNDCEAYAACSLEQCDAHGTFGSITLDNQRCYQTCLEASSEACPGALDSSELVLLAWQDAFDLGANRLMLASAEAALLGDRDSCLKRYPVRPPKPCSDVVRNPVYEGCSTAGEQGPGSSTWCVLLLLWAMRRRVPR